MTTPCEPGVRMGNFATAKTRELVGVAASAISAAVESPDESAVHKMRVSLRRLQQGLRLFRQFLRKKGADRVRAETKLIMEPAGELRNYDIALGLLERARQKAPEILARQLAARELLRETLSGLDAGRLEKRWLRELGVAPDEALET